MQYKDNSQVWLAMFKRGVSAGTVSVGKLAVVTMQESFPSLGRFRSSPAGMPPNQRRSGLSRSFQSVPSGEMNAMVFSQVPYAHIHELGGTIKPKNVKYLPVPINEAAMRLHESKGTQSLRSFNMRLFKLPSGRMYLRGEDKVRTQQYVTGADGKRREVVDHTKPVFRLMRSVRLPKRPYAVPALEKIAQGKAIEAFATAFITYMTTILGEKK